MSRYANFGQVDSQPLMDGDGAFIKFVSRGQNTVLEPGMLERSENMRLNRTTAKVRAGLKSISTDLNIDTEPLVLDFDLAPDFAVTSITRSVSTATVTTTTNHGYATSDLVNIRGAVETDYNGDKTITVTGLNTFTYTVSGSPATPATGTIIANRGPIVQTTYDDVVRCAETFATDDDNNTDYAIVALTDSAWAIRGGTSSQQIDYPSGEQVEATDDASMAYWNGKVYIFRGYQTSNPSSVSSLTRSGTTATADTAAAHNLQTNDWVFIQGASPVGFNGIFQVTVTDADTFTYTVVASGASPATGTITARPCKPAMSWDGNFSNDFVVVPTGAYSGTLIHMPPVAWGVDFMNRLVVPYDRDEILLSDIYDANSYDTLQQQVRIRGGTADHLVAVHPYQESELIVFYHDSIHLLQLTSTLTPSAALEVTRDIGCASRRSICTCGSRILWLSERGVQSLTIGDLLSIRQASQPISDDIDDIIQRINWAYSETIVATYWDNRYYLAVPLDSQTVASTILVYNFINQGWESVDTYPAAFNVVAFHQMNYANAKRLHVSTTFGFVYLMEEEEADEWGVTADPVQINGAIVTRYYTGGTVRPKKLRRFLMECNLTEDDSFETQAATKNMDSVADAVTTTALSTTDQFISFPTYGLFGTGAQLRITTTYGRPEFRTVTSEFQGEFPRLNVTLP